MLLIDYDKDYMERDYVDFSLTKAQQELLSRIYTKDTIEYRCSLLKDFGVSKNDIKALKKSLTNNCKSAWQVNNAINEFLYDYLNNYQEPEEAYYKKKQRYKRMPNWRAEYLNYIEGKDI